MFVLEGSLVNEFIQVLQSISILVGIWVGIATLGVWRQEFISKRRIELAEEWLASTYAFRDSIWDIRNPLSSSAESASRPKTEEEKKDPPEVVRAKDQGYVFYARYNSVKEQINNFYKLKYTTMARFGKPAEEIYGKANKLWNELAWGADIMREHWYEQAKMPGRAMDVSEQVLIDQAGGLIWRKSKDDVVEKQMKEIVKKIEDEVKLITEEKYTFADLLNFPFLKNNKH